MSYNNLRYDSFTFVFFTTIYSILINDISLPRNNNISDLIKLIEIIFKSLEKNEKKSFWTLVKENPNYSLNILYNNGFEPEYHIHNIFNWFIGDKLFVITYNILKTCQLCFYFENKLEESLPYFSVDLIDLNSCSV